MKREICERKMHFISVNVRNLFSSLNMLVLAIKCSCQCNYCGVQYAMINNQTIGNECSRCSEVETKDCAVKS